MDHDTCGSGAPWCARADALFGVAGMHVVLVGDDGERLQVVVETEATMTGCPGCGSVARVHGRREHRARDAPCFGRRVVIVWRKRVWRCPDPDCGVRTWSETHRLFPSRSVLTTRAVAWAVSALRWDDTTVSALARHLGVDWHTLMDAITAHARGRVEDPARVDGVRTIGVDEHIWRPSHRGADRAVTGMVDLTRDEHGNVHARLLDVVKGRSGVAYATWLQAQPEGFTAAVEQAALDPFRGYANAIRDELPDAVAVLDAFHVVRLGTRTLDDVRCRVQEQTLGHRGRKDDPLYRIRGVLRHGAANLTPRGTDRLAAGRKPVIRPERSPWPGSATSSGGGSTTPAPPPTAAPQPRRS